MRENWNTFVQAQGPRSGKFLQSWQWGEFQKAVGEQIERRQFIENGKVVAQALWIKKHLPFFGEYWYAPRGPIGQSKRFREMIDGNPFFIRMESELLKDTQAKKTIDLQPAVTNILDLSLSEEELLAKTHQKMRYNIRLAAKKGVHVSLAQTQLDDVWSLFVETGKRGEFRLHPKTYYQKQLASLNNDDCRAFLASAYFESHPIAATIMIDFGGTRTYVHGASGREYRQLMAPALLHWEMIRDAKHKGLRWYDWWGVAPAEAKDHPWEGISRFKRGFGGEDVEYPGTYDVVLKPARYQLYTLARKIRRSM